MIWPGWPQYLVCLDWILTCHSIFFPEKLEKFTLAKGPCCHCECQGTPLLISIWDRRETWNHLACFPHLTHSFPPKEKGTGLQTKLFDSGWFPWLLLQGASWFQSKKVNPAVISRSGSQQKTILVASRSVLVVSSNRSTAWSSSGVFWLRSNRHLTMC